MDNSLIRCRIPKDLIRVLINEYFDDHTVLNCMLVCKFMLNSITNERKIAMHKGIVNYYMKRRYDEYINNKIEIRVRNDACGDKSIIDKWISKPKIVCEYCEEPMFNEDVSTHDCIIPEKSSKCKCCGYFFKSTVHRFRGLSSCWRLNPHNSPCPLQVISCSKVQQLLSSCDISVILSPCHVKQLFQQIILQHRRQCIVTCLHCDSEIPLVNNNHFKSIVRPKGSKYDVVICKKIK